MLSWGLSVATNAGWLFAEYNRGHATNDSGSVSTPVHAPGPGGLLPPKPGPRSSRARRDIHADANAGWRNDWLDERDELPSEQYHVNLFMGMHSGHLVDLCNKMRLGRRTRFRLTWVGGAVVSPFLWAMIIFMAEILLPVFVITLGTKQNISDKVTCWVWP